MGNRFLFLIITKQPKVWRVWRSYQRWETRKTGAPFRKCSCVTEKVIWQRHHLLAHNTQRSGSSQREEWSNAHKGLWKRQCAYLTDLLFMCCFRWNPDLWGSVMIWGLSENACSNHCCYSQSLWQFFTCLGRLWIWLANQNFSIGYRHWLDQ